MHALLVLAVGLGVGAAGAASAQYLTATGVNLSWTDCGASGALDRTFACNQNVGSDQLVVSFFAPANADSIVTAGCEIDLVTPATDFLEPWWELYSGGCRHATTVVYNRGQYFATCADLWQGTSATGTAVTSISLNGWGLGWNTMHVHSVRSVPVGLPIVAGQEYFGLYLVVPHQYTVGAGSCAGCTSRACVVLNEVLLEQPASAGPSWKLGGATAGGRDYATWQGAGQVDCVTVPARNRTWGQIKTMFR